MWRTGLALAVLICTESILAQNPEYTLNLDAPFVSIDVTVNDQNGRPIGTLQKEDFQLFENGVPKEIRNFAPIDSPYGVLLLFDCSNSTLLQWPFLANAMARFFDHVRPHDQIAIALFGSGHRMVQKWNLQRQTLLNLDRCPNTAGHSTDVYGALDWAADELKDVKGRRGVVVLTDGLHNGAPKKEGVFIDSKDDGGFQKALRAARQSSARFYFVAINTDLNSTRRRSEMFPTEFQNLLQMRARMQQIADATGGTVTFPQKPEDVISLYKDIGLQLGTAYSLGYLVTPGNAGYRRIVVRVKDGNAQVSQSRDGYQAP